MRSPNLNVLWARVLLDALVAGGVRHVCMSPGSRSAPLVVALHDHPLLTSSIHIDERSAAYFALGVARAQRVPCAVLCTSGTAAANFHPAVLEAHASGTPLVVLTADRPPEARGAGAAQTIDQRRLYGGAVRAFHDLPLPEENLAVLRAAAAAARYAVARSCAPRPGPVHLNVPFREPLAPLPHRAREVEDLARLYTASLHGEAALQVSRSGRGGVDERAARELAARLGRARRGWIVAGPESLEPSEVASVLELSLSAGLPILSDIASPLRFAHAEDARVCAHADLFLQAPSLAGEAPDLVVRLGGVPTSRRIQDALSRHRPEVVHLQDDLERRDPESWDTWVIPGPVGEIASAVAARLGGERAEAREWIDRWARAEAIARSEIAEGPIPLEPSAILQAVSRLPRGGTLFLSNSLPIRWAEGYLGRAPEEMRVHVSRGVNGIDGMVSTALGSTFATSAPTLAVLGDLAFLHDVGGLQAARWCAAPAVLLVLNNEGGGIFAHLPIARFEELSERYFETPHGASLAHAAALFGVPHVCVSTPAEVETQTADALRRPGVSVIELRSDRRAMVREHAECVARIVERLESPPR